MEYYEMDPEEPKGLIEGIVSYPSGGPRSGSVQYSNVTLLSVNGSIYSRTRTDKFGFFDFDNVKLKRHFKVRADPPEGESERYLSVVSDLIFLNDSVKRKQIGLVLGYEDVDMEYPVVEVLEYGPVGMNVDPTHVIYIRFSHTVTNQHLEGMIKLEPVMTDSEIYLSDDRKTLYLRHDGLDPGTRYNVSVSIMLEFEGVLGLNETFKWPFWTDEQLIDPDDGEENDREMKWWIPVAIFMIIVGAVGLYLYMRKNREDINEDYQE